MQNAKITGGSAKEERDTKYLEYRIRNLPLQLDRAYRRVKQLEAEARSLNMQDLIRREKNETD